MTTGLYWYLHYRRGTGDLSQIIVMDQSDDPWLQDPSTKRSGETRPGESAPALIKRYRAGMLRRTEADPTQARKKAWVEASAAYTSPSTNFGPGTGQPSEKGPLPSNHGVIFSGSFPVMGSVRPYSRCKLLGKMPCRLPFVHITW